ncbi:hypothetical protein CIP107532_01043 [Corynebacterium diphtheriae]|nr:hypothetical protein CIP107532_01043 [Corynebacterium diphtheriae]
MMIDRITWMFRVRMVITGLVTFMVLFYALVTKSWIWWLVVAFIFRVVEPMATPQCCMRHRCTFSKCAIFFQN